MCYQFALLAITGVQLCGITLTVVSFFSLQPLEFCGLKNPIYLLMGTRYVYLSSSYSSRVCVHTSH